MTCLAHLIGQFSEQRSYSTLRVFDWLLEIRLEFNSTILNFYPNDEQAFSTLQLAEKELLQRESAKAAADWTAKLLASEEAREKESALAQGLQKQLADLKAEYEVSNGHGSALSGAFSSCGLPTTCADDDHYS